MLFDDFRFDRPKKDCVLSGRFTRAEDAEFRELAERMSISTKEMVRKALMEWKTLQKAVFASEDTGAYDQKQNEGGAHDRDRHQEER